MYPLFRNILSFFLIITTILISENKLFAKGVYSYSLDTVKNGTITLPAFQKDTTGRVKLLQKIIKALQFRRNARAREQQRVIAIIKTVMADSMVATAADIRKLNAELSLQQNQHFDSLRALIEAIQSDTIIPPDINVPPTAPVTDADVEALVNKMLPILQQKARQEKTDEAVQQQLQPIRALYGRAPGKVDTLRVSDTLGRLYTLQLGHKARVTGIHPYWMGDKYLHYNFSALSEINYYGYTSSATKRSNSLPFSAQVFAAAGDEATHTFTLFENDAARINALLNDETKQLDYIDSVNALVSTYNADGVTIWFSHVGRKNRNAFTAFVHLLGDMLAHNSNRKLQLSVVIPAYDEDMAYDLKNLAGTVQYFLVDFTKAGGTHAGALAPMKGDPRRAIEPVMSRWLNQGIPPSRFMLLLSYYGTQWKKGLDGSDIFTKYVAYNEIKSRFPGDSSVIYDEDAVAAIVKETDVSGEDIAEIWFDDAYTLEVKYDYVLNSGLGGVAIWPSGADDGHGELWDMLSYKFLRIDTLFGKEVRLGPVQRQDTTWLQRIIIRLKHEAHVLQLLFTDPCALDKEQDKDHTFFAFVTLFFGLITLLLGGIFAWNVRMKGAGWQWKRPLLRLLIAAVLITFFFAIVSLFLNRDVPFGITRNAGGNCVTVPMLDLLLIFSMGLLLGMLIMRILIKPLLVREEKP